MLINLLCNAFHYNAELLFLNVRIYFSNCFIYLLYVHLLGSYTFQNENEKLTKE